MCIAWIGLVQTSPVKDRLSAEHCFLYVWIYALYTIDSLTSALSMHNWFANKFTTFHLQQFHQQETNGQRDYIFIFQWQPNVRGQENGNSTQSSGPSLPERQSSSFNCRSGQARNLHDPSLSATRNLSIYAKLLKKMLQSNKPKSYRIQMAWQNVTIHALL